MLVYVQMHGNTFQFDGAYAAYEGAEHNGIKVDDIIQFRDIMEVPARPGIMVVASIEDTRTFFKRIGMESWEYDAMDAFDLLRGSGLIKRKYQESTLEEFMKFGKTPKFIKPRYVTKGFPSGVVSNIGNLPVMLSDYKGPKDIDILEVEVVDMVSEYRVFVRRRKNNPIVGMRHYQGDPFLVPSKNYITEVINYLRRYTDLASAYTLDVAVMADGTTQVVEMNDGWSVGSYGLDGETYFGFLLDRWLQLMENGKANARQRK